MPVAIFLWFFLGIFGAHKIYLGRVRQGIWLVALYLFLPILVLVGVTLGLLALGVPLIPPGTRPEDVEAIMQGPKFLALAATGFLVIIAIGVWDLIVLIRQVREHNEQIEREAPRENFLHRKAS